MAAVETITEESSSPYFQGLRTCLYIVPDLDAAKAWYREASGVAPYFDEPFYVGFSIGGFELGLLPAERESGPGVGGVRVYWGVDDVASEIDRLVALGAREYEAPQDVGGDIVTASVLDPWGNPFGLIRNPHFKA